MGLTTTRSGAATACGESSTGATTTMTRAVSARHEPTRRRHDPHHLRRRQSRSTVFDSARQNKDTRLRSETTKRGLSFERWLGHQHHAAAGAGPRAIVAAGGPRVRRSTSAPRSSSPVAWLRSSPQPSAARQRPSNQEAQQQPQRELRFPPRSRAKSDGTYSLAGRTDEGGSSFASMNAAATSSEQNSECRSSSRLRSTPQQSSASTAPAVISPERRSYGTSASASSAARSEPRCSLVSGSRSLRTASRS
mmetsp:Transcript_20147/g.64726  ORF Transcript_20147/g.64726 Transcript_20147/m.64726 type:complete len:250 (+) Transcript_20147:288-1037(+)